MKKERVIIMTKNVKMVLEVLNKKCEGVGFAADVHKHLEEKTFNSVNATLAASEKKGFVTKEKAVNEAQGKILTKYTITDKGVAALVTE